MENEINDSVCLDLSFYWLCVFMTFFKPLNPKPMLVRDESQPILGPLVLDAESDVKVPGSINTFLREYQRDGVRFFWEHYKGHVGALLGDDMGLVCECVGFT